MNTVCRTDRFDRRPRPFVHRAKDEWGYLSGAWSLSGMGAGAGREREVKETGERRRREAKERAQEGEFGRRCFTGAEWIPFPSPAGAGTGAWRECRSYDTIVPELAYLPLARGVVEPSL